MYVKFHRDILIRSTSLSLKMIFFAIFLVRTNVNIEKVGPPRNPEI